MNKLKFIENKVQEIQENIVAAKYNMVHPSMLTKEEIEKYEIDCYTFFETKIQLITPLPNKNKIQISEKEKDWRKLFR